MEGSSKTNRIRSRRGWIAIGVLGLSAIAIAEVGFRTYYAELLKKMSYPLTYLPSEAIGYRYIPNAEGRICLPSICKSFKINRNGFTGSPFTVRKKPGDYRIAIVGASNATGLWMNGDLSFDRRLQELFDESGHAVEIVNFSIDGRGRTVQKSKLIQSLVTRHEPDLILMDLINKVSFSPVRREPYKGYLIHYYPVDWSGAPSRAQAISRIDRIEKRVFLRTAYEYSYVVRAAVRYLFLHASNKDLAQELSTFVMKTDGRLVEYHQKPIPDVIASVQLRRLNDELQARGMQFAIFDFMESTAALRKLVGESGVDLISLGMQSTPETVHEFDGHFNQNGHLMIADALYAKLLDRYSIASRGVQ